MNATITVETDLFEHREVKAHFINPCCFGEDFAAWLNRELTDLEFGFSDVMQEDYGWGFWASRGQDRFRIALSYVGSGPQEPPPAQWVISVSHDPGLNLIKCLFHKPDAQSLQELQDHIRQAVSSNSAMTVIPAPDYSI